MAVAERSAIVVGRGESTKAKRRQFTMDYKAAVVQEAERCREAGEIGGLLRREGLYSSQLADWRKLYRAGARTALAQPRGPKTRGRVEAQERERLQKENEQLRRKLAHAEQLIGLQKKLADLLGPSLPDASGEPR